MFFDHVVFFFNYIMADKVNKINAFLSIYTHVTVFEYVKNYEFFGLNVENGEIFLYQIIFL
jgi:hypothetical protein